MTISIDVLNKVELSLALAGESGAQPVADSGVEFEFIFGVATDGLSSFELALKGKNEGEHCTLTVSAGEANEYFGYHFLLLKQLLSLQILPETIHLNIHVISIKEAESREIVQSIAKAAASCNCGGVCGCG